MGSFVKEAAFYLRARLLEMQKEVKISNGPMTKEDIIRGQGDSPKELLEFFTILCSGKTAATESQRTNRLVKSVCDDIAYATSQSHVKLSKHLCLGLSIKSLTGSHKVLEVLNRLGHCISYHTVETIETDLATNISQRNYATPEGIVQKPGLCTGLAWDNYDENTETLSGAGTLHDTDLSCQHEEADTRLVYLLCHISKGKFT